MSYSTHDTDWAESKLGNFWRRVNGAALIVDLNTQSRKYLKWVSPWKPEPN